GVGDVDGGVRLGDGSCDPPSHREADLARADALGDLAPQLAFRLVDEEEGAAIGLDHAGGRLNDELEQPIEIALGDESLRHLEDGYSREELEKMDARQLHPPEDAGQLGLIYEPSRAGVFKGARKMARPGMRHRRKDGSTFDVETLSSPLSFEGIDAHMVVVRDISDRRKLEALEARCRALFDHSRDIVLMLTWDGRI